MDRGVRFCGPRRYFGPFSFFCNSADFVGDLTKRLKGRDAAGEGCYLCSGGSQMTHGEKLKELNPWLGMFLSLSKFALAWKSLLTSQRRCNRKRVLSASN